ncbi:hypothetical protein BJX63DRAFT_338362 [Aspergillus granulosus]|uniref:Uncharacterized protein n=1 Tax=Aspergillus granulosus TaxID=176169 RepID=A0ABR4HX78_9EURO
MRLGLSDSSGQRLLEQLDALGWRFVAPASIGWLVRYWQGYIATGVRDGRIHPPAASRFRIPIRQGSFPGNESTRNKSENWLALANRTRQQRNRRIVGQKRRARSAGRPEMNWEGLVAAHHVVGQLPAPCPAWPMSAHRGLLAPAVWFWCLAGLHSECDFGAEPSICMASLI